MHTQSSHLQLASVGNIRNRELPGNDGEGASANNAADFFAATDEGTNAWFVDIAIGALEQEGDLAFNRVRAPLFSHVRSPHYFSVEERRRMDCYESIDYSEAQSFGFKMRMMERSRERRWMRWVIFVVIGLAVGLWSVLLFQTLDFLAELKLHCVQEVILDRQARAAQSEEKSSSSTPPNSNLDVPLTAIMSGYAVYILWCVGAALLSSLCCVVMPSAAGSGIPDVMAYLNGIMFPRIFNIRNLVVKTLSCILAVSAGLPVGTEGPMIHIGSLIGAGLPTGRSRSLHCSATTFLRPFRNAKDERDFISAGAACGLTSAFSSPLGGMLFVLEEMATFFPSQLAWMVLVSCLSCTCVIQLANTYLSGWRVVPGIGSMPVGNFRDAAIAMFYLDTVPTNSMPLNGYSFIAAAVIAVITGLLAVLYTLSSVGFTRWRARKLFPRVVFRILEPGFFALLYGTCCYFLPLAFECIEIPPLVLENKKALHVELFGAFCRDPATQFHPLATLTMSSPYNILRLLFSRQTRHVMPWWALLPHLTLYTLGCSYAGGMFISCGTVIPTLLIGAVTGRLAGESLFGTATWADPGVLALVGASSYFAGISRLSFALIVIMMELTSDLTHVTCLMLAVIIAKGIADRMCHPFYHAMLEVKAAPFLEAQSSIHQLDTLSVKEIMSENLVTLDAVETVIHLVEVLTATSHHAFPTVSPVNGSFVGLISRAKLQLILWVMWLREEGNECVFDSTIGPAPHGDRAAHTEWLKRQPHVSQKELFAAKEYIFWNRLPPMPPSTVFPIDTLRALIDLTPYIDTSPYYVQDVMCISRAYYIFRHLGLRHLPVLDRNQRAVGILTRTNFVADRLDERMRSAERRTRPIRIGRL